MPRSCVFATTIAHAKVGPAKRRLRILRLSFRLMLRECVLTYRWFIIELRPGSPGFVYFNTLYQRRRAVPDAGLKATAACITDSTSRFKKVCELGRGLARKQCWRPP